jgi:hypothetical protein
MNKEEFLQLVRLDDSITKLNLKVLYDGVDVTGEIKFFVSGFPDNHGIFFVVNLENHSLTYQLAKFEEKLKSITAEPFETETDALIIIRNIIAHFYMFTMMNSGCF